jgi:hypothetical protein
MHSRTFKEANVLQTSVCVLYLVDNTVARGLCRRVQVTYIMSTYWLFVQALLPHACRNNDMRLLSTAQCGYLNWQHRLQGDVVSSCFVSCTLAGEGGVQKVFHMQIPPPHTHTHTRARTVHISQKSLYAGRPEWFPTRGRDFALRQLCPYRLWGPPSLEYQSVSSAR